MGNSKNSRIPIVKLERVMGIEPTCQVKIEEVVLRQVSCLKGTG